MTGYERPDDDTLRALHHQHGSVERIHKALDGPPRETIRAWYAELRAGEQAKALDVDIAPVDLAAQPSPEDILRAELREARRALDQYRKADLATERMLRAMSDALGAVQPPPFVRLAAPVDADEDAHHRHLLLLSDFHGGERVDGGAVHGLNTYDWEIQERRVDEALHAVLSHQRRAPALTGLDVLFVGDMCSGHIHKEIAETNQYPAAEQAVRMGYLIARIVQRLHGHYPDLRVGGVVGNHGRMDKAPAAKEIHNNLDWLAYKLAEALLRPAGIECRFPEAPSLLWEIAGRTIYVWHGDGVRSSMPGVPWGGVMRRVNEIARQHLEGGVRIDHFALGHFHQANVVQRGRILMNGSLKGLDEWVLKSFGGGDGPVQLLVEFDERRARMTNVRLVTPSAGLDGTGAAELAA